MAKGASESSALTRTKTKQSSAGQSSHYNFERAATSSPAAILPARQAAIVQKKYHIPAAATPLLKRDLASSCLNLVLTALRQRPAEKQNAKPVHKESNFASVPSFVLSHFLAPSLLALPLDDPL